VADHRAAGRRDRGPPMTGLDMTRPVTICRTTIGRATSGDRIRAASAAITANPANGRGAHLVRTTRPDRPVAKGRRARTAAHLVRTTRLDRHVAKGRRARTAAHPALRAVIALEARDRRTPAIDTRIGTRIRNEVATHSDARRMGEIAIRTAGRPATVRRRDRRRSRHPMRSSPTRSSSPVVARSKRRSWRAVPLGVCLSCRIAVPPSRRSSSTR